MNDEHPQNGDPVVFRTAKGCIGGKSIRTGAMITWGEKLCLVWGLDQHHGGLDVVDPKDVFTSYEGAEQAQKEDWARRRAAEEMLSQRREGRG
jgi:hypothetical protein